MIRILVIELDYMINACIYDDNEEISELISCFMNSIGAKSHIARNLDHCKEIIHKEESQILFLDYNLYNHKCGLDICLELSSQYPELLIIMMSGDDDRSLVEKAFKNGAIEFMRKPLYLGELTARVTNLLNLNARNIKVKELKFKKCAQLGLSVIESKIFECLLHKENNFVWKKNIMESTDTNSLTLSVHVSNLRKKISGYKIKSKPKFGYGIFKE